MAPNEVPVQTVFGARVVIDPLAPETLYAGALGVLKSTDGGATWRSAGLTRTPVSALAIDPKATATSMQAPTRASSRAPTRARAGRRSSRTSVSRRSRSDPQQRQTVYAGTDRGVFWTADGGQSWRRFTPPGAGVRRARDRPRRRDHPRRRTAEDLRAQARPLTSCARRALIRGSTALELEGGQPLAAQAGPLGGSPRPPCNRRRARGHA